VALSDFVVVDVSISSATTPTVQGLNTGALIGYHNHYPDRLRVYSTATALTQMVSDGFSTTEPLYKMAQVYAAAPNAPALMAVGRRALAPHQSLALTCTDGTVGDAYALTVINPAGVSTLCAYTNIASLGEPIPGANVYATTATTVNGSATVTLSATNSLPAGLFLEFSNQAGVWYTVAATTSSSTTVTLTTPFTGASASGLTVTEGATTDLTVGSVDVTFSANQSLAVGDILAFSAQPGTFYALSAAVVSSTSGVLTTAYNGLAAAASPTSYVAALAGTFHVIAGNPTVATTSSQVSAVAVGDSLQFVSQLNTFYTVAAVSATTITLSVPYAGTTASATYAADMCTASTAATALGTQISAIANVGTVTVTGAVIDISRTDGSLTDILGWVSNGFANIQMQDNTADPGIATDLTAIRAANNGSWYGFALDSNSGAEIQAAAVWTEATGVGGKIFFTNNSDYQNTQVTEAGEFPETDIFTSLQGLSIIRTFIQQNNSELLARSGAAIMSQVLAMNPGSYTLAYKQMPLVPADSDTTLTETQALNLNSMTASNPGPGAKSGNYYKTVAGQNWLFPGSTPDGVGGSFKFMDLVIGVDWLQTNLQADVAAVIAGLPKLPYTNIGMAMIKHAIYARLSLASSPQYGLIVPDGSDPTRPIVVTVPNVSNLTPQVRASRGVAGITWSAGLQGAIETAVVTGTLLP
jgi:uncharacterized protein DUF3383